jgi:hypothetical protein
LLPKTIASSSRLNRYKKTPRSGITAGRWVYLAGTFADGAEHFATIREVG